MGKRDHKYHPGSSKYGSQSYKPCEQKGYQVSACIAHTSHVASILYDKMRQKTRPTQLRSPKRVQFWPLTKQRMTELAWTAATRQRPTCFMSNFCTTVWCRMCLDLNQAKQITRTGPGPHDEAHVVVDTDWIEINRDIFILAI